MQAEVNEVGTAAVQSRYCQHCTASADTRRACTRLASGQSELLRPQARSSAVTGGENQGAVIVVIDSLSRKGIPASIFRAAVASAATLAWLRAARMT